MGAGSEDRTPLAWQATLASMRQHGTRLAFTCGDCRAWVVQDVPELIRELGLDTSLWGERPPCKLCGGTGHYMASPGPSTPFTPLLGGALSRAERQAFLRQFGFTKRDIMRIQALADEVTQTYRPAALNDLDVPYRVGAQLAGEAGGGTNGEALGQWNGRILVWWAMNEREREAWEKKRRTGPKPVPSRGKR
jgi:hypothetical protein